MKNTWNLFQVWPEHEKAKTTLNPFTIFWRAQKVRRMVETTLLFSVSLKGEKNAQNHFIVFNEIKIWEECLKIHSQIFGWA